VVTPARRVGYRLLGAWFDYLLHTRPAEWPIMAAHTFVGYLLAVGVAGAARGERIDAALLGVGLWVICLNGGTLALNSAFDRDEGDIAYLRQPPPPPAGLAVFGVLLMVAGLVGSWLLPPAYRLVYAVCLTLSALYSVPPVRLKSVPGADWAINMIGFGTLTPYAGWVATGWPVDSTRVLVLLAFCPLFAALYPLTQIYQFDEDRRRGDQTLAGMLGPNRSLRVSIGAVTVAFGIYAWAGIGAGWVPADWWRWLALGLGATAWAMVLVPWLRRHASMHPADHQKGMYRALGAWAITDVAVVLAWGT
jgi:4-hydroxybenzoate polyprenyltransferase